MRKPLCAAGWLIIGIAWTTMILGTHGCGHARKPAAWSGPPPEYESETLASDLRDAGLEVPEAAEADAGRGRYDAGRGGPSKIHQEANPGAGRGVAH